MCDGSAAGPFEARAVRPRPATGPAVDPIRLEPVDAVEITVLVDNVFDALLPDDRQVRRSGFGGHRVPAPQFDAGSVPVGLVAEHGFGALVRIRRGGSESTLLFDTGLSPHGLVDNADRIDVDLGAVRAVVLSHGHFDHAGGLAGLIERRGARAMPIVLHPRAWTRRRLAVPGREPLELPTLSVAALRTEGFELVERREPSLLLDGCVLITGEIDRTTEFERGMPPPHQAWTGSVWEHDPLVTDDQALVVHVRGRGLVVLTGCGHAGAVNIVRHARRLTAVDRLHALVGGLHLGGPAFEPSITPTVAALADLAPDLVMAGHCTGWRAQQALAAALPAAWRPSSSGTTVVLEAESAA